MTCPRQPYQPERKYGGLQVSEAVGLHALDLGQPVAAAAVAPAQERLSLGGDAGLLLNAPRPSVLRFMPALNVTLAEVDLMVEGLGATLDAVGLRGVASVVVSAAD